jgi:hypothetical protein
MRYVWSDKKWLGLWAQMPGAIVGHKSCVDRHQQDVASAQRVALRVIP